MMIVPETATLMVALVAPVEHVVNAFGAIAAHTVTAAAFAVVAMLVLQDEYPVVLAPRPASE